VLIIAKQLYIIITFTFYAIPMMLCAVLFAIIIGSGEDRVDVAAFWLLTAAPESLTRVSYIKVHRILHIFANYFTHPFAFPTAFPAI
jgi:hypothetical protein